MGRVWRSCRVGWGAACTALTATYGHAASIPPLAPPLEPEASTEAFASGSPPPFRPASDPKTHAQAADCLAAAIYYEAADQSAEGRRAVAQVVINRVRHPNFPKSVCGVVYQGASHKGCQFTFACDGSLTRTPDPRGWREALEMADRALDGFVETSIGAFHSLSRALGSPDLERRSDARAADRRPSILPLSWSSRQPSGSYGRLCRTRA